MRLAAADDRANITIDSSSQFASQSGLCYCGIIGSDAELGNNEASLASVCDNLADFGRMQTIIDRP